jgi:hypothetical protein
MLPLYEEIERLKNKLTLLEIEQERQDKELHERIKDFEEISRLEAELLGIDYAELKEKVLNNIDFIRDEQQSKELESKLEDVAKERLKQAKTETMVHDDEETLRLERELAGLDAPKELAHYFVLHLTAENGTIAEWSEANSGWHEPGSGDKYTERKQALQVLHKLRKRFAGYKIDLVESSDIQS